MTTTVSTVRGSMLLPFCGLVAPPSLARRGHGRLADVRPAGSPRAIPPCQLPAASRPLHGAAMTDAPRLSSHGVMMRHRKAPACTIDAGSRGPAEEAGVHLIELLSCPRAR